MVLSWSDGARLLYLYTDRSLNEACPWNQSINFGKAALFSLGKFPDKADRWGLSINSSFCGWRAAPWRGSWHEWWLVCHIRRFWVPASLTLLEVIPSSCSLQIYREAQLPIGHSTQPRSVSLFGNWTVWLLKMRWGKPFWSLYLPLLDLHQLHQQLWKVSFLWCVLSHIALTEPNWWLQQLWVFSSLFL